MSKFKVGDIVTWNNLDQCNPSYKAVMHSLSEFGPGPFMITKICDMGESYNMKEIFGEKRELNMGWFDWALREYYILEDKRGFIWSNIGL